MFVANIPSINDCTTLEGADYACPNPGEDTERAGHPAPSLPSAVVPVVTMLPSTLLPLPRLLMVPAPASVILILVLLPLAIYCYC